MGIKKFQNPDQREIDPVVQLDMDLKSIAKRISALRKIVTEGEAAQIDVADQAAELAELTAQRNLKMLQLGDAKTQDPDEKRVWAWKIAKLDNPELGFREFMTQENR